MIKIEIVKNHLSIHIYWENKGDLYRLDGPAVIWYKEGKIHRDDGPAVIRSDGTKVWYKEGKFIKRDRKI